VIRDQTDLRRIFERKMQERQEFIDRYFVFSDTEWTPPIDWSRTNGLVEDIRQSYAEIEEQVRLEEESKPLDDTDRGPSSPIELPTSVREGSSSELVARQSSSSASAPANTKPNTSSAPAAKPRSTPAQQRQPRQPRQRSGGGRRGELDSPIIINPIARSVNVERVE